MSIEETPGSPSPVADASPVPVPVSAAPAAEAASSPAPIPAPAPAAVSTPVAETPASAPVQEPSTLLSVAAKAAQDTQTPVPVPEVAKQADGSPAPAHDAQQKADGSQSDEPAPLPTYEPFTLPEGVTADEDRLGSFTKTLAEFEVAKADHTGFQKFGQQLVEMHVAELQTALNRQIESLSHEATTRYDGWLQSFLSDPEIGGNRKDTTLSNALQAVDIGNTQNGTVNNDHRQDFFQVMEESRVGNHPAVLRTLSNLYNVIEGYRQRYEREDSQPLAATRPVPQPKGKVEKRYGYQ